MGELNFIDILNTLMLHYSFPMTEDEFTVAYLKAIDNTGYKVGDKFYVIHVEETKEEEWENE